MSEEPASSAPLATVFGPPRERSALPDADALVRDLGFRDAAVDFLSSGVARDLRQWQRDGRNDEVLFVERDRVVRWGDATVHDYRSHLLGLLRNIGVDHTGTLLKRRRRARAFES